MTTLRVRAWEDARWSLRRTRGMWLIMIDCRGLRDAIELQNIRAFIG